MGRTPQRPLAPADHRCSMRSPLRNLTRADVAELLAALDSSKQAALFRAAGLRVSPRRTGDRMPDLVRSRLRGLDETATHNVAVGFVDVLRQALSGFEWDCEDDDVVPQIAHRLPQLRRDWSPNVLHVLFATAADIGAIGTDDYRAIAALVDEGRPATAGEADEADEADEAPPPPVEAQGRIDVAAAAVASAGSALDDLVLSALRRGERGEGGATAAVEELLDLDASRAGSWYLAGFAAAWLDAPQERDPLTTTLRDAELRGRLTALTARGERDAVLAVVARHGAALDRIVGTAEGGSVAAATLEALLESEPVRAAALLRRVPAPFPGYAGVLDRAAAVATALLAQGKVAHAEDVLAACDDTVASWSLVAVDPSSGGALEAAAAALAVQRVSCRRRRADFVGAAALLDLTPLHLLTAAGAARAAEERALIAVEVSDPAQLRFPRTSDERKQMASRLERAEGSIEHARQAAAGRGAAHMLSGLLAWCRQEDARAAVDLSVAAAAWPAGDVDTRAALSFHGALARARLLEPGTDGAVSAAMLDALASGYQPGGDDLLSAIDALEAHGSPVVGAFAVAALATAPSHAGTLDAVARAARVGNPAAVAGAAAVADDERLSLADRFELLSAAANGAAGAGAREPLDDAVDGVERVLTRACDPVLELRWAVSLGTSQLRDAIGPLHADAARIELLRRAGVPEEAAAIARRLFYRAAADREAALDPTDLLELIADLGGHEDELASLRALLPCEPGAEPESAPSERSVRVLFVGGNEVQMRYHASIDAGVATRFGGQVEVQWFTPGWSANWSPEAARIEAAYDGADALVLMSFVRTLLGRRLRRTAGEAGLPWIACTGHGRASLERAVVRAVSVVGS